MRRCIRAVVVALTVMVMSFGMLGAVPASAAPKLTFWHGFTQPDRINLMRQLADQFEKQYKCTVEIEVVPWAKMDEKWTSAMAAGVLPDVVTVLPDTSLSMWFAGASKPVDGLIEKLGGRKAFLSERTLDNFFAYDGKPVALPYYAHSRVLLYRKDLFNEKGLNPPKTWDEYINVSKALTNAPRSYGMIMCWGKGDWGALAVLYPFMRSNGGAFFDNNGNVVFNSPENVEAVKQLVKMYEAGSIKGELGLTYHNNIFELFTGGRTAMTIDTAFMVDTVKKTRPDLYDADALGVFYPPYKKQYGWFADAIGLALMNGKQPDLASKFMLFLYQTDNYVKFLHTVPAGQYPVLKSVANSKQFWDNPVIQRYPDAVNITLEGIANGTPIGFEGGPTPFASLLKTGIIEEMFHRIIGEGVSPEKAVADTHNELARLVKAQKARMQTR